MAQKKSNVAVSVASVLAVVVKLIALAREFVALNKNGVTIKSKSRGAE